MLVRDVMQTKLVTVTPGTTLPEAMRLAAERRIRHLPVVERARRRIDVLHPPAGSLAATSRSPSAERGRLTQAWRG